MGGSGALRCGRLLSLLSPQSTANGSAGTDPKLGWDGSFFGKLNTGICGFGGLVGFDGFAGFGGFTGLWVGFSAVLFSGASSRIGDEIVGRPLSPQSGLNISLLGFGTDTWSS